MVVILLVDPLQRQDLLDQLIAVMEAKVQQVLLDQALALIQVALVALV